MIKMTNDGNVITIIIRRNGVIDDINDTVIDCNKYLTAALTDKNEYILTAFCDKTFIENIIARLEVVLFTQLCNYDLGEILASLSAIESAFSNFLNEQADEGFIIEIDGGDKVC